MLLCFASLLWNILVSRPPRLDLVTPAHVCRFVAISKRDASMKDRRARRCNKTLAELDKTSNLERETNKYVDWESISRLVADNSPVPVTVFTYCVWHVAFLDVVHDPSCVRLAQHHEGFAFIVASWQKSASAQWRSMSVAKRGSRKEITVILFGAVAHKISVISHSEGLLILFAQPSRNWASLVSTLFLAQRTPLTNVVRLTICSIWRDFEI